MTGMANYAHNVVRATLSGTMFGGNEQWSTGFFIGEEGADAADPTQQTADAIRDAWAAFFVHAQSGISAAYRFTQCKVAKLDDNGQTIDGKVFYSYPAGTVAGVSQSGPLPAQCSLVVTLLSDRPRGKASKGRMYLPGIAISPEQATGKINSVYVGQIADRLKIFYDALASHVDIPGELILAAKSSGPLNVIPAQNDYVETIKVGDVIDTQRRRRNGLNETYTSRVLA